MKSWESISILSLQHSIPAYDLEPATFTYPYLRNRRTNLSRIGNEQSVSPQFKKSKLNISRP